MTLPCSSNIGGQVNNYATILPIEYITFKWKKTGRFWQIWVHESACSGILREVIVLKHSTTLHGATIAHVPRLAQCFTSLVFEFLDDPI